MSAVDHESRFQKIGAEAKGALAEDGEARQALTGWLMKNIYQVNMKCFALTSILIAGALITSVLLCPARASVPQGSGVPGSPEMVELGEKWKAMHDSHAKQCGREQFNNNKYGMFIHWGLYSQLGGVWKGEKMEEGGKGPIVAEWIMRRKKIPRAEYAKLADRFNPVNFDAEQWVSLAKAAGMRYMVITSKHHDGFSLFDSEVSNFNAVDATPFGRDIIRELEQACKKHELDFGVYYSHSLDWRDGGDSGMKDYGPEQPKHTWAVNDFDPAPIRYDDYIAKKSLPQVRELVNNYDLTEIWLDVPLYIPARYSFEFYKTIYEADPQILVNQRIGNGFGDIGIPGDNIIPAEASENTWEGIATTNNSWGYKSYDDDWKSPSEILYWLLENVSKGGNFLLNVGPDGTGRIPPKAVNNLLEVGKWLNVNGQAIYGAKPWKITHEGPTRISMKGTRQRKAQGFKLEVTDRDFWFTRKNNMLYVIAMRNPEKHTISIESLQGMPIQSMRVLNEKGRVRWSDTGKVVRVTLPDLTHPTMGYVLEITFASPLKRSRMQESADKFSWKTRPQPIYRDTRDDGAKDPSIIKRRDTSYMFHTSANPWQDGRTGGLGKPRIDYATSKDGCAYTCRGIGLIASKPLHQEPEPRVQSDASPAPKQKFSLPRSVPGTRSSAHSAGTAEAAANCMTCLEDDKHRQQFLKIFENYMAQPYAYQEKWRPRYHFSQALGRINDPNGLVYFDGKYILSHQALGMGTPGMRWGHAHSRDLVHWDIKEPAVFPDENGVIYSGTAAVDWHDTSGFFGGKPGLVAMFTYSTSGNTEGQCQGLAFSRDGGGTWYKYAGNPVIPHHGGEERIFIDPKIFWHESTQSWKCLVGGKDKLRLFTSKNTKEWELAKAFDNIRTEVPDFFEMSVNGDPNCKKWVLSRGGGNFLVGAFDGYNFEPEGGGSFHAGPNAAAGYTFNNIPEEDGRTIMIYWHTGWDQIMKKLPEEKRLKQKWNGALTLPRKLGLVRDENDRYYLTQQPVRELKILRGKKYAFGSMTVAAGEKTLSGVDTNTLEIVAEFEIGSAKRFGFMYPTFHYPDESTREHFKIGYDAQKKRMFMDGYWDSDRRVLGMNREPFCHKTAMPPENGRVRLRIFVDVSVMEAFGNNGVSTMTAMVPPVHDGFSLSVFAEGGDVEAKSINIYELKSIWNGGSGE